MAPITIPEGHVFVPRRAGVSVAAQLLAAADKIKADRVNGIRTVGGGYHVTEEIAKQYQASVSDAEVVEADEADVIETIPGTEGGDPINLVGQVVEDGEPTTPAVVVNADGSEVEVDEDGNPVLKAIDEDAEEVERPDESWTVAQIEDWAGKQEPAIVFPADATKKADKLAFLNKPAD